ncbi:MULTISPECIES: hypothetical protein [Streptomyces]|uniref:hypothetical protein n=1 Tax=Streptomyces TaxID=1883 RepID=UPI00069B1137
MSRHPRLLPWPGPAGQPSYLVTDDGDSLLSRLADEWEEIQLGTAEDVLRHSVEMLGDQMAGAGELRFVGHRLCEALRDALRVAESRGGRLSDSADDDSDDSDDSGDSGDSGDSDDSDGSEPVSSPAVTRRASG